MSVARRPRLVVTGTDTGVGKTVFAAGLTSALDGCYWKPVQAGLDGETDSEAVARLSGLPRARILPEAYRLKMPASPHFAAQSEGLAIDPQRLVVPDVPRPLVIEGAGGLLVPLSHDTLLIDVLARWRVPVVLCARTSLGTINHTLLSLEALARRAIPLLGIAFIGQANESSENAILEFSGARRLGRLEWLDPLDRAALAAAFQAGFAISDFLADHPASRTRT